VLTTIDKDPKLIKDEVDSIEGRLWKDAMLEDMESLHKNETWDLVELPNGRKRIGIKWVFNKKMNLAGQVDKLSID
jgi:hypothetical protein